MEQKKVKKTGKKKFILKCVLLLIAIGLVAYLMVFSIKQYQKITEANGIVVCNEQECVKTMHIHADIEFDLCGNSFVLPRETGPLNGLHTHKEKNYLHFHDKVDLDPSTKAQLFDKRLSIQEVIDLFGLIPEKFCGNDETEVQVVVNGVERKVDYNWKDADQIKLIYHTK